MEKNGSVKVGERYKVIFQDSEKVLIKRGIVLCFDNIFLTLKNVSGLTEIIPLNRILRMEAENDRKRTS